MKPQLGEKLFVVQTLPLDYKLPRRGNLCTMQSADRRLLRFRRMETVVPTSTSSDPSCTSCSTSDSLFAHSGMDSHKRSHI